MFYFSRSTVSIDFTPKPEFVKKKKTHHNRPIIESISRKKYKIYKISSSRVRYLADDLELGAVMIWRRSCIVTKSFKKTYTVLSAVSVHFVVSLFAARVKFNDYKSFPCCC